MNTLLLTNYVILLMLDRYFELHESRRGLHYANLLPIMEKYQFDKKYGVLVSSLIPINLLIFMLSPLFIIIKDE